MPTNVKLRIQGENRTDRAFQGATRNLQTMEGRLRTATGVARRFVGILAGTALVRFSGQLIDSDDAIGKLSRSLGVSTEELSKLQFAAQRASVPQRAFETGIRTLIQVSADAARGNNEYADSFKQLGIDAGRFGALTVTEQVEALADAFNELGDADNREDLAIQIFGSRGGIHFLELLRGGSKGIQDLGRELEELGGVVTREQADKAEAAADAMTDLSAAGTGLAREVNSSVLPAVTTATNVLTGLFRVLKEPVKAIEDLNIAIGRGDIASFFTDVETEGKKAAGALDDVADSSQDVVEEQVEIPKPVAAVTEQLKKQEVQAKATASALDRVRGAKPVEAAEPKADPGEIGPSPEAGRLVGEEFKQGLESQRDQVTSVLSTMITSGVQSGAKGALQVFSDMLLQMATQAAASKIFEAFAGALSSGGGGGGSVPRFNSGGIVPGPIGQPRVAIVEGGETILPTHKAGYQSGSTVIWNVDASGADPAAIARLESMIQRSKSESVATMVELRSRGRL